jgi:enoyl-CoA hydratase
VEISYELVDHVALIGLNAPERANALSVAMADELTAIIHEVAKDTSVGAAVIHGAGPTFCSGAHVDLLRELGNDPTSESNYRSLERVYRSFQDFGKLPVPTIAATKGSVVGGGVNLMLSADLRLAGESTRVQSAFLNIGVHPGGGFFTLSRAVMTDQTSAALTLFGEELDAKACVEHGLAWSVIPDERLIDEALRLTGPAAKDPELAREITRTMRMERVAGMTWDAAVQLERAGQMWSLRRKHSRSNGFSS